MGWAHTVARFCAQRSELGVAEHWYDTTALDDLLGIDTQAVNDARLYRALAPAVEALPQSSSDKILVTAY